MSRATTPTKLISRIFVGSLVAPVALAYLLALSDAAYRLYLASLMGYAILGYTGIYSLARRNKPIEWFLSLAVINLLLITPELVLRQAHFQYESGVQFGYPRPTEFQPFVPDAELFWRFAPDQPGVNSLGFWGDEVEVPKPADTCRIVFLGDSVPQQGYPRIVKRLLNERLKKGIRFESANLAIAGYSTYQGRILTDRFGDKLEPDLVVVSYGWNDHWQAYGSIDSEKKMTVDESRTGRLLRSIYHRLRLLQWLRFMLDSEEPLPTPRVPADEYRENLGYIGNFFATRSVPVIFITPPSAHPVLGVPDQLIEEGFAASKEDAISLHQAYNQIVRNVAAAHDWPVLDLERAFISLENPPDVFFEDGIHLTPGGSSLVAERIADFVVSKGLCR